MKDETMPGGSEDFDAALDTEAGALMREMNFREVLAIAEQWGTGPTEGEERCAEEDDQ